MRIYYVTGAASGIGKACVIALQESGNTVIGIDIANASVNADLSTQAGRKIAAQEALKLSDGVVDGVIACAGLIHPISKTVSVNYFGVTEFLNELLPTLARSKNPRVAVISSMASLMPNSKELVDALLSDDEAAALKVAEGLVATGGGGEHLIYGSTKRALSRWVRRECIKPEWAGAGIPLNAVGPGIVKTPMAAGMISSEKARKAIDSLVPMPLNYYMEPETVASLLIWLTGEANTHITGQTIYIDGGSDAVLRGENIWD